ncbi:DUF1289 domain-containing protein [Methyloligella sp. 2.7D]|uniref:DUF1289 domain-containing protein n=1 Tax=unclassified Methyloligella TaxID=2625955 RepID=UPI00157C6409|nr:DUF1289 domain-containing protein [Methyloligella sp. GL2]QKP77164.1 DUF1289 domain-containing protein [Methyloligella sp. GL2]
METPCISVCEIDEETEMCRGCGRSIAEIASWIRLTDDERRAIMARLPERLKTMKAAEKP